jgi:hypothetical protein
MKTLDLLQYKFPNFLNYSHDILFSDCETASKNNQKPLSSATTNHVSSCYLPTVKVTDCIVLTDLEGFHTFLVFLQYRHVLLLHKIKGNGHKQLMLCSDKRIFYVLANLRGILLRYQNRR